MKHAYQIICFLLLLAFGSANAQTANPQQYKYVFTVSKDGTGDFKFIQDAIDAMRVYPLAPITLFIRNGIYNEKIELPANNTDVTFIGESVEKTIITFNDHAGRGKINTFTSFTVKISGNRFRACNITFANTAGPVGQALALYVDADQAIFFNCRFLGNQDTIFCSGESSRQLFVDCYIEGTTDFIFGPATTLFRHCTIFCKTNSYITAANTTAGKNFGFVFKDCRILADSSVTQLYLGRPWRAYAKTVFLKCDLPAAIVPAGWNNWNDPANEKTVFYAEFQDTGAGAVTSQRVPWSKQLTASEAARYDDETIFSGAAKGPKDWYKNLSFPVFNWPVNK